MSASLTIDGRTFDGTGTSGAARVLERLGGWLDGPPVRGGLVDRPAGHGSFAAPAYRGARVIDVTLTTLCSSDAEAAAERQWFTALLADGSYGDLSVTEPGGLTTSASVQISDMPLVTWFPHSQAVRCTFQFVAPDPLRYGDPTSATTGFPVPRGGLKFDLYTNGAGAVLGWLDYGEPSLSGRVTLSNPGTADVPILYQVTGPIPPEGFDIVEVGTGRAVRFEGPVAAGSVLVLSGADGTAVIDGVADRGGQVTRRDWPTVRKGSSVEVAFIPLGESTSAQLTAVVQPGWW